MANENVRQKIDELDAEDRDVVAGRLRDGLALAEELYPAIRADNPDASEVEVKILAGIAAAGAVK